MKLARRVRQSGVRRDAFVSDSCLCDLSLSDMNKVLSEYWMNSSNQDSGTSKPRRSGVEREIRYDANSKAKNGKRI